MRLLKITGWKCAAVITLFLVLLFFIPVEVELYAAVTDVCSNCHTMHNSQDNQSMRLGSSPAVGAGTGECLDCHAENRSGLLRMDCIGCHTLNLVPGTPQVVHNSIDLAGGNFKYLFDGNDRKGHNVHGFGALVNSGDLGNAPSGYDPAFDPSTLKYNPYSQVSQIMCAGANGCHGDRSKLGQMDAMKGAHHSKDDMLKSGANFNENAQAVNSATGNEVGTSFRMLLGVRGMEDTDWEATKSSTDHNEYKGDVSARSSQSYDSSFTTISDFCASCHGDFHKSGTDGMGGPGSPWLRHPVDILLPNEGEYASYNYPNTSQYSLTVPVAWQNLSGAVRQNVTSDSVVMCLSCHRAHASEFDKIMRWNYKSTSLSEAISGCAVCHTSMN